ncbi:hypothetical protein [Streptomyces palmae]|uniref:ABM domain-containing protein n=1 Tax=Streptomyces palmae TaxID=1701085 RepID=A0A4Z0HAJ7_9ACTN|nr:hypothetical protein [Streptomyces palmae]TGB13335.1 hypothetical protein E4099_10150 [Streptomyces palmae]
MRFVQVIEYETAREEEMSRLFDEWMMATEGRRTVLREYHTRDRERPNHYVDILEFPSYEQAMVSKALPETERVAERLWALCDGEPRFIGLEVLDEEP